MGIFINQKITINFIFKEVVLVMFLLSLFRIKSIKKEKLLIFKQGNTIYIEEKERMPLRPFIYCF